MPTLSVVIPCHNCPDSIQVMLKQLQAEKFQDWECICVDNSPNNDTMLVLKKMAESDPRIVVKKGDMLNSAADSRNIGLRACKGEFVWIVDSDDEFSFTADFSLGDFLEKVKEANSDIVFIPCSVYAGSTRLLGTRVELIKSSKFYGTALNISNTMDMGEFFKVAAVNPWNKVFKRAFLVAHPEVEFQDLPFCNDNYFSISAYNVCNTVAFLKCPDVYKQNKVVGSTSSAQNRSENLWCIRELLEKILGIEFRSPKWKYHCIKDRLATMEGVLRSVKKYRQCTYMELAQDIRPFIGDIILKNKNKLIPTMRILPCVLELQNEERCKQPQAPVKPKVEPTEANPLEKPWPIYDNENKKHDAMFILGDGSIYQDKELALAVHSMRKFCPFIDRIFIVGSKPRCSLDGMNCIHVPCNDLFKGNKDANIMYKVSHGIKHIQDLSDDFLLCSDDQMVTKPCVWEDFKPKYIKKFNKDDPNLLEMCNFHWGKRLYDTLVDAASSGREAYFYEPHVWSPVNKKTFLEMLVAKGPLEKCGVIKSQYYNFIPNLNHEKIHDHRFFYDATFDWSDEFKDPRKFISYNEKAFDSESFRQHLVMLLK